MSPSLGASSRPSFLSAVKTVSLVKSKDKIIQHCLVFLCVFVSGLAMCNLKWAYVYIHHSLISSTFTIVRYETRLISLKNKFFKC